jgi:hypothetical protein
VSPGGLHTFVAPTIVHFGAILVLSAFLCAPGQTLLSAGIGLGTVSIAALMYVGYIARNMYRNLGRYVPVAEDWIWHLVLPTVAYAAFGAMAILTQRRPGTAADGVGAASVLLLFIGIHNAWDIAVWMTLRKQQAMGEPAPPEAAASEAAKKSDPGGGARP